MIFVDIDECQEVTHNCVFPMECINIAGGFQCECSRGYGLDQDYNNCTDIPNTGEIFCECTILYVPFHSMVANTSTNCYRLLWVLYVAECCNAKERFASDLS